MVVSTHLKNISQTGSFSQVGMKIKNVWNHHPEIYAPMVQWKMGHSKICFLEIGVGFHSHDYGRKGIQIWIWLILIIQQPFWDRNCLSSFAYSIIPCKC